MSASPSAPSGSTPNGAPVRRRRPKPQTNPLVANRRPQKPKSQPPKPQPTSAPATASQARPTASQPVNPVAVKPPVAFVERPRSPSPDVEPNIYPVYTTKRALLEGLRHHVARLQAKTNVDIRDVEVFTRPVRLHRRDPAAKNVEAVANADTEMKDVEDDKEKERMDAVRAERQRVREENAKLIAPSAPSKRKVPAFKKKTEQVFRTQETVEEQKRSTLRYEEALPWHIEDFDNNHVWVGSYEAALSDCHVMLMMEDGHFRLIPVEKWYRFREKSKFKRLDSEAIEKMMNKKVSAPRWFMEVQKKNEMQALIEKDAQRARGFFQRSGDKGDDMKAKGQDLLDRGEAPPPDADEIDFDHNEEFQDDDENQLFEGDLDDQKEAAEKIKREQRNANVFDMNDQKEVEEEEELEKKLSELQKQLEKGTRKALLRREKNFDYEDDSDGNPYTSESESEDSETERQKEAERKREEERKAAEKGKGKEKGKEDDPSGTSTKGNNTPSGRKKGSDLLHKASTTNLKRPGSPNLTDASGNESSRKKPKKSHKTKLGDDKLKVINSNLALRGAGSGSESESIKRSKMRSRMSGSPEGTPRGSRAGSPAGGARGVTSTTASRPGSPPASTPGASARLPADAPLPSVEDILATIPPEGMNITELTRIFRSRVAQSKTMDFIRLVRNITHYDATKKSVHRKTQAPAS